MFAVAQLNEAQSCVFDLIINFDMNEMTGSYENGNLSNTQTIQLTPLLQGGQQMLFQTHPKIKGEQQDRQTVPNRWDMAF